jgi:undecaprenyl-diphosphatase
VLFLELASEVAETETQHMDGAVLTWIARYRSPSLTNLFLSVTALGSSWLLLLLSVGVCSGAWLAAQRRLSLTLAAAMLGVPLLSSSLKSVYARDRPTLVPHLEHVTSASFPSGHTLGSVVFCVTLGLLVYQHTRLRRLRIFIIVYALGIGALVAASRMYLGVHYPSDVIGGALIGITWSLVVVTAQRWLVQRSS